MRNYTQINTMDPHLVENILHDTALAWGGEEDFIDEAQARMLKKRIVGPCHIACTRRRGHRTARHRDETFEDIPEVANTLDMVTQGMRFRARADDQDVARIHSPIKAVIEKDAVKKAAQAQCDRHKAQRDEDTAPRNVVSMHQIKGTGEQQTRRKKCPHTEVLLVHKAGEAHGRVEPESPADDHESDRESAEDS